MKMRLGTAVLGLFLCIVPCLYAQPGNHAGEQKALDVDIHFTNPLGTTVTDAQGVAYQYGGYVFREDKIYPQQYWGIFPLYFFDLETGVLVRITNNGPREKMKVRVVTEAYVLRTDGSNGAAMKAPQSTEVEVARGETKTINASFVTPYTPDAESGLDRFIVKVLHVNEGGGPGNSEPGLIMAKEGIYCPPKFRK
jgi:hypothetical protein